MRIAIQIGLTALTLSIGALGLTQAQSSSLSTTASPKAPEPVTAAERASVIKDLADALQGQYLDPETGTRYATLIRANLAEGIYEALVDPTAFGERLTADLQTVSPDGHLRLAPQAAFGVRRARSPTPPANTRAVGPTEIAETRMIGDVAYLRFNEFPDEPQVGENARSFLLAHSDAKAVIIDVRTNRGGGLMVMAAILPMLYPQRTTLVRMDLRASAPDDVGPGSTGFLVRQSSPDTLVRYDHIVVPDASETRLQHVPVYYLISRHTVSAAEHLALAFQRTHRAVLIGEATAGANHFGTLQRFGRFAAFIPVGRTYDPDTGWDWEGKGVSPDVAVPADQALEEALKRADRNGNFPV